MMPGLLKRIIRENAWQERHVHQTNAVIRFTRFAEFLQAELPEGLRADVKTIKRLCFDDPEALDLLDQVTGGKPGNPTGANQHKEQPGNHYIVNDSSNEAPQGNSRQYALRRLRKDRPDLHEKVLSKDLSAHAAMKATGFVKIESPLTTLKRAWGKASPEERKSFVEWIAVQPYR